MVPDFKNSDPLQPAFWNERFEQRFMPWDRAGVPRQLQQFVMTAPAPMRTFIPGCGVGHEVAFLAGAGWDVYAIDFSQAAVAAAHAAIGEHANRVVQADFFSFDPPQPLQLIYERAFLCALPRAMWPRVVSCYAAHLPPGGLLAGFFFFDGVLRGPPFGAEPAKLAALLAPMFEQVDDQPVPDSIKAFEGRERWQVWRRR
ncbi:MAG: hypothetical protein NVSMB6_03530 [Burkholderiaceae bacterium]